ncbi:MAG: hypothetical protein LBK99_00630 [Opitutaceae bacterium]|jgi:hypothetical protein|nr:hypothetical protein [Opitutaceae bacterium]
MTLHKATIASLALLPGVVFLSLLPPVCGGGTASPSDIPKLAWAHYVGWGFDFAGQVDNPSPGWRRLDDRSLSGSQWTSSDTGLTSTTRTQILAAMQYGLDGFTVDIIPTEAYATSPGRLYQAAEGLPFYISLCVDGWPANAADKTVEHLAAWFRKWGTHPNNHYIDGKPVIFIYKTSRTPEESAAIVQKLKDLGHEAYWLVQPQRENTLWDNAGLLDRNLATFDGLYDFGSNGITQAQMTTRLENGRRALTRARRPDGGVLVAGITQGYNGSHNAFYRPFHGTGTLRQNWEAALAANATQVCLTTWNDYTENTHFEPSAWGRDTLLCINREYLRRWRGTPLPPRPPQVFAAYKNEVRLGDDWTLEIQSFPYTWAAADEPSATAVCHTRLADMDGRTVRDFPPVVLQRDHHTLVTHRLEQPGFDLPRQLRIHSSITTSRTPPASGDPAWRELYPLVIRPGIMRDYRTIRVALRELLPAPTLRVTQKPSGELEATATLEDWSWVGAAELLCNGRPLATLDIAKEKTPGTTARFTLPARPARQPVDLYTVRFTRADGRYAWSRPALLPAASSGKAAILTSVLPRAGDFDETWGNAAAVRVPREITVPASEIYGFTFPMDDADARHPRDTFGWNIVALGGGARWGKTEPAAIPRVIPAAGSAPAHFRLDGKASRILVEIHALPHDTVTIEARIRPQPHEETGYVFSDQNRALDLGLAPDGRLFVQRADTRLVSGQPIPTGEWSHVAAVYDGATLRLYINGKPAGEKNAPPSVRAINSIPAIGCKHEEYLRFSRYYRGDIAGLSVVARPLQPAGFSLSR